MRSVRQFLRVMEALTARESAFGLRELARYAELNKSSVHRILRELQNGGFVQQTPERKYKIGPAGYTWAAAILSRFELRDAALVHMREIVERTQETMVLAVRHDGRLYFVEKVECAQPVRYVPPMGVPLPLHAGSAGKVILAYLSEPELRAYLRNNRLTRITARTITTERSLRQALENIRRNGWAASVGERIIGTVGVAAPLFDGQGRVLGSLDLVMPENRFRRSDVARLGQTVKNAATGISRQLGFRREF
jgi:IclR family KDG regulon transcriptional repressor